MKCWAYLRAELWWWDAPNADVGFSHKLSCSTHIFLLFVIKAPPLTPFLTCYFVNKFKVLYWLSKGSWAITGYSFYIGARVCSAPSWRLSCSCGFYHQVIWNLYPFILVPVHHMTPFLTFLLWIVQG